MAPAGLLALQRSAGNHATVRAIQRMRITIDPAWFPQPQPQQGAVAVQTPPAQVIDTATMDRHQLHQLFAQLLNQYAQDQNIHVIAAAL
ncbi:MAG: hypothetical protein ACJ8H8_32600, partial [Geminicoccaceae bacterium]